MTNEVFFFFEVVLLLHIVPNILNEHSSSLKGLLADLERFVIILST